MTAVKSMSAPCYQFAYVTNDFDRALYSLRLLHGIGPFKEMRDHSFPTGAASKATVHVALAFKSDLQFEIIQPLADDVNIYTEALVGGDFCLKFHHIGYFHKTPDEYRERLTMAKNSWSVPIDVTAFGGMYAYADARNDLGHYLELLYFPDGTDMFDIPHY